MGRVLRRAGDVVRVMRGAGETAEVLVGIEQHVAIVHARTGFLQRIAEVVVDGGEQILEAELVGDRHRPDRIADIAASAPGASVREHHQPDVDVRVDAGAAAEVSDHGPYREQLGLALRIAVGPVLRLLRPVGGVVEDDQDVGIAGDAAGGARENIRVISGNAPRHDGEGHGKGPGERHRILDFDSRFHRSLSCFAVHGQ